MASPEVGYDTDNIRSVNGSNTFDATGVAWKVKNFEALISPTSCWLLELIPAPTAKVFRIPVALSRRWTYSPCTRLLARWAAEVSLAECEDEEEEEEGVDENEGEEGWKSGISVTFSEPIVPEAP
jgi:hypothetical protein